MIIKSMTQINLVDIKCLSVHRTSWRKKNENKKQLYGDDKQCQMILVETILMPILNARHNTTS